MSARFPHARHQRVHARGRVVVARWHRAAGAGGPSAAPTGRTSLQARAPRRTAREPRAAAHQPHGQPQVARAQRAAGPVRSRLPSRGPSRDDRVAVLLLRAAGACLQREERRVVLQVGAAGASAASGDSRGSSSRWSCGDPGQSDVLAATLGASPRRAVAESHFGPRLALAPRSGMCPRSAFSSLRGCTGLNSTGCPLSVARRSSSCEVSPVIRIAATS